MTEQRQPQADTGKRQAVVIGAGPAGLTAALELLRQGRDNWDVTILEETSEIGGISRTVRHHGNRMDIGGHRFFSRDPEVMRWWQELLPPQGALSFDDRKLGRQARLEPGGPDPEQTDEVMLYRHRISRIYYQRHFFDYPIRMSLATFRNLGLWQTLRAGFSYLAATLNKKPETSLENFYINRFGRVLYSMFFEGYTEKLWGRHPRAISADWGAQRVKGLSIRAVLKDIFGKIFKGKNRRVETSLIEEFLYPKFGPGQLWEKVASEAERLGARLVRDCRATGFEVAADGQITAVRAQCGAAEQDFPCDAVFSSMPVKDLARGLGAALPQDAHRIAAGLPYRDFVTVGLLVDRLELENKTGIPTLGNIVPDCWIYVQDTGVKLGRIQVFNNWSPYLVQDPEHTVWLGLEYFCDEGDAFWSLSEEATVEQAVAELRSMGVLSPSARVLDSRRERVRKAYPAYFDTYAEMDQLKTALDGFGNLYCIGRNGQHRYNNMDHSMVTAFEAVRGLLAGNPDRTAVWQVNTEKEYHEEKSANAEQSAAQSA